MTSEVKRVFFGLEAIAPWPQLPKAGRLLDERCRHMTLAFLGETDWGHLKEALPAFPQPPFRVGLAGQFDECLFLPFKRPHVVAWHIKWLDNSLDLEHFQKELINWVKAQGLKVDNKDRFLPHVTVCRQPTDKKIWQQTFEKLPVFVKNLHLYESLGHSKYQPIWTYALAAPFEEIEHTADIAYQIRGENIDQIYQHAKAALSFRFPALLDYFPSLTVIKDLDDIIIQLNEAIARADEHLGCPFKAVSFHGNLIRERDQLLRWEMIIDV